MPTVFVIAIFEKGLHVGYWDEENSETVESENDAQWYGDRPAADEQLGEIPRKVDARIYCLMPSSEPITRTEPEISSRLPEFLKA